MILRRFYALLLLLCATTVLALPTVRASTPEDAPNPPPAAVNVDELGDKTPEQLALELAAKAAIAPVGADGLPEVEWNEVDGLKLLSIENGKNLKEWIHGIVDKLRVPGDSPKIKIDLVASMQPNAYMTVDESPPRLGINIGLLFFCRSEDQIAAAIAHEMTHANKSQFSARTSESRIESIAKQIESAVGKTRAMHREEIRADVGAIDRLIKAGYNPWEFHDFHKTLAIERTRIEKQFPAMESVFSSHPKDEIRMTAVKVAMLDHSGKKDISKNIEKKTPLPAFIGKMKTRAELTYKLMVGEKLFKNFVKEMKNFEAFKRFLKNTAQLVALLAFGGGALLGLVMAVMHVQHNPQDLLKVLSLLGLGVPTWSFIANNLAAGVSVGALERDYQKNKTLESLVDLILKCEEELRDRGSKKLILIRPKHKKYLNELRERLAKATPTETSDDRLASSLLRLVDSKHPSTKEVLSDWLKGKGLLITNIDDFNVRFAEQERAAQMAGSLRPGIVKRLEPFEEARRKKVSENPSVPFEAVEEEVKLQKQLRKMDLLMIYAGDPPKDLALKFAIRQWSEKPLDIPMQTRLEMLEAQGWKPWRTNISRVAVGDKFEEVVEAILKLPPGERTTRIRKGMEHLGINRKERDLILKLAKRSPEKGWGLLSITRNIVVKYRKRKDDISLFSQLDEGLEKELKKRMVQSITEMEAYLQKEIYPYSHEENYLKKSVNRIVQKNPGWIKTQEDIDIMLRSEMYWRPTATSTKSNPEWVQEFDKIADFWGKNSGARYIPGKSEPLHMAIAKRLKALGTYPKDFYGKFELWQRLAARGLTTPVQDLFEAMRAMADPGQREKLDKKAIQEDWIWQSKAKASIVDDSVRRSKEWTILIQAKPGVRAGELSAVINKIEKEFPKRGMEYQDLLERMSRDIQSTESESALITTFRNLKPGEWTEDAVLRAYSGMLTEALSWPKKKQWELLVFLRGGPSTRDLDNHFEDFGTERVVREFQQLSPEIKAAMLDSFLSSPKGLLQKVSFRESYPKKILHHLMGDAVGSTRDMAQELLEGFLYSLEHTGNEPLRSSVLAFLLARPAGEAYRQSSAETLKAVLEAYGATGVKIGQFLTTAGILSDADSAVLSQLQDRAKIPLREEIYADLRKIYGGEQPYEIIDVLGAASMKVAVRAVDRRTGKQVVLKILREDAVAHTPLEFKQLDSMVEFLVKRHGKKYSVLKTIVRASEEAVKRELNFEGEIERSAKARSVYSNMSDGLQDVAAPMERLEKPRLIVAELAPGASIKRLPPEDQDRVARKIVEMETRILSSDNDIIYFDADRHPGNYLAQALKEVAATGVLPKLSPIDFGQLISITGAERRRVTQLFAPDFTRDRSDSVGCSRVA